jgi:hypothetical protein
LSASLYDSLVLGGVIELAGGPGGVPSTNPMCPGATFTLDPDSWDLDNPQPTQDYVATLSVDGERPFGTRASDRNPQIGVFIKAPDFLTLAGARELLYKTIDAQQWTMVWTPRMTAAQIAAGQLPLPVVYDCFRAKPSKKKWGGVTGFNNEPVDRVDITFEALPYGRSDTKQQLAFASPIAQLNAPAPPPAPVVLDSFTSINSPQFSQTPAPVVGPFAGFWDPAAFGFPDGAGQPLTYSNTFAAPLNLTGMTSLKVWCGLGSRYYFNHQPRGRTRISLTYTLTDTAGIDLSWTVLTGHLPVSQNPTAPAMSLIAVRIPQAANGFNYASVASYALTMVNRGPGQLLEAGEFRWTSVTLDALTAYPSTTIAAAPSSRGTVYDVHGVVGTHYAPVSVTAQSPPTAGSATAITATGPGAYTVPANTIYCAASCIGAGGPGATMTTAGVGGGGGGGEESYEPQLPGSSAGVVIPYNVGAGSGPGTASQSTTFGPVPGQTLTVTAHPGTAAAANSPAGALGGDGSVNTQHFPGGTGRTASGGLGGGGGSSAGTAAAGNTPQGTSSQTFTSSSSFTIPSGAGPVTLGLWGAGGGGAGGSYGGAGGGGGYLSVTLTLAPGSYPFTIGAAGSGGSSGSGGSAGGATTITIGGTTYTAHGGHGGTSGGFFSSGSGGDGGSGSPGEQPGGDGGDGYPYGGGGGSSAGPGAPGNDGNSYDSAGIAPTGGGNGGAGSSSGSGHAGATPGGGGGASGSSHSGAAGGGGQLTVTYSGGGAPTASGASAPAGGGAGGGGGASAGTAGSAGSAPGGGGGGGNSSGAAEAGGAGGNGKITVTPYGYAAFSTLLLHRPGLEAPSQLSPLISIGGVAPGAAEFPVPPITARTQAWGFEDGTTSSFTGSGAAVANSTAWANGGTHSLLVTADGTNPGGQWYATSPRQPASPGQFVSASVVVKNPNASTTLTNAGVSIDWYSAGGYLSTTAGSSVSILAGATATVQVTGQAPAGAAGFQMTVIDGAPVSAGVLMAFDDLTYTLAPPAQFDGTYTILVAFASFNNPTVSRTLQVTVNQYEASGGTKWSTSTDVLTFTPTGQVTNGLVDAGNLTLPWKDLAKDNAAGYYTVQITDSNTSDTVYDLLLIDNNGQTVLINESGSGYLQYYIDEPDPRFGLGKHLGSQNGRPQAISVMDAVQALSGGPLTLEPGDNKLLAWSLAGAPILGIEYFPRWYQERLE